MKKKNETVHINPVIGENFYKIKVVNSEGKIQYSSIRLVIFERNGKINIAPNTVQSQLISVSQKAGQT